jgi:spermidine synthase
MTLGSVLVHPEVERVTLAEIEPGVFGATRTFGRWNHQALDSPKLRVVRNDGRNFLWTTRERFDVITADPIHPWSGGAAYLYTDEYFRTVAARLAPGGVACQWLAHLRADPGGPQERRRHLLPQLPPRRPGLTYADAELLGSDAPFAFDRDRLSAPPGRAHRAGRSRPGGDGHRPTTSWPISWPGRTRCAPSRGAVS